jgi:hypothetical protein
MYPSRINGDDVSIKDQWRHRIASNAEADCCIWIRTPLRGSRPHRFGFVLIEIGNFVSVGSRSRRTDGQKRNGNEIFRFQGTGHPSMNEIHAGNSALTQSPVCGRQDAHNVRSAKTCPCPKEPTQRITRQIRLGSVSMPGENL